MAATYTVKQVANILGYSTNSIYTFLKEKRIKGIRVGTGRFRIPQSELDRLLLITKKAPATTATTTAVTTQAPPSGGVTDVVGGYPIGETKLFGFVHLGTLNIFDWFIGASAIVTGFGLFLFNTSLDKSGISAYAPGLTAMRIILIGCGIGVLATNITGHTHRIWHKLFHVLLGLMGVVIAVVFFLNGEIDGSLTYGTLALLVLLSTFIHIGGAAWMCLFISFLVPVTTAVLILMQNNPNVAGLLSALPVTPPVFIAMVSLIGLIFLSSLWWGYFRHKGLFWMMTWLVAFWYFAVAFWYANDAYWARSFMFLVLGMTGLFLSPWEMLVSVRSRRADLFTLGVFAGIFTVLLLGLATVYLMQTNSVATVERENTYKVSYAQAAVETTITSIQDSLLAASGNQSFVAAVAKGDLTAILATERIMYESNNSIRRVVLLDSKGMGVNLYPEGTFSQKDFSSRDYFKTARDSGKPYVSDLFESAIDSSRRLVVSVAVPLFDPHKTFVGVLIGSVNLDTMSARLQKIAVPDRDEYIVVVDSHGKRLVHPTPTLIGTDTEKDDLTRLGLSGQSGAGIGITYDGKRAVIVYAPINTNGVNWSIAIKSPVTKMYMLTNVSNLSLFSVIVAAVILAGVVLQGGFFYRNQRQRGSSP